MRTHVSMRGIRRGMVAAAVAVCCLAAGMAVAKKRYTSNGGEFSSIERACRYYLENSIWYEYSPPKKQENGLYLCMMKMKDGKGPPEFAGQAWEEDVPDEVADMGAPADMASACTSAEVRAMVPGPTGQLAAGFAGLVADYGCGHCNMDSVRVGERVFANTRGAVRMNRWGTKKRTPNHYFLRHGALYVDSAFLQFFDAPIDNAGPIFVGTEAQLRKMLDQLLKKCGLSRRCTTPKAGSGDELFNLLYRDAAMDCDGKNLRMRSSGERADWVGCGV